MVDPHNYRSVGWSMIAVAGALAIIGLLALAVGHDPYFSDRIMKQKQAEFKEMKESEAQLQEKSIELDEKIAVNEGGQFILGIYLH